MVRSSPTRATKPLADDSRMSPSKKPAKKLRSTWYCPMGCNKKFGREADLRRHMRTSKLHTPSHLPCPHEDCMSQFTRTDALRRHQKSRHNGVVIELESDALEANAQQGSSTTRRKARQIDAAPHRRQPPRKSQMKRPLLQDPDSTDEMEEDEDMLEEQDEHEAEGSDGGSVDVESEDSDGMQVAGKRDTADDVESEDDDGGRDAETSLSVNLQLASRSQADRYVSNTDYYRAHAQYTSAYSSRTMNTRYAPVALPTSSTRMSSSEEWDEEVSQSRSSTSAVRDDPLSSSRPVTRDRYRSYYSSSSRTTDAQDDDACQQPLKTPEFSLRSTQSQSNTDFKMEEDDRSYYYRSRNQVNGSESTRDHDYSDERTVKSPSRREHAYSYEPYPARGTRVIAHYSSLREGVVDRDGERLLSVAQE